MSKTLSVSEYLNILDEASRKISPPFYGFSYSTPSGIDEFLKDLPLDLQKEINIDRSKLKALLKLSKRPLDGNPNQKKYKDARREADSELTDQGWKYYCAKHKYTSCKMCMLNGSEGRNCEDDTYCVLEPELRVKKGILKQEGRI